MPETTVDHDFNGHEDNRMYGVNWKKCYDRATHLVNKSPDFMECMDLAEIFATTIFSVCTTVFRFSLGNFEIF